jgi:hypothetical protein
MNKRTKTLKKKEQKDHDLEKSKCNKRTRSLKKERASGLKA